MTAGRGGPAAALAGPAEPAQARTQRPVLDRLGQWTALHPRTVLAGWLVLLTLAVFSAGTFASRVSAQSNAVDGSDSAVAERLIRNAFPTAPAETDFVVLHSDIGTAGDPDFRAVVRTAVDRYRTAAAVRQVTNPYDESGSPNSGDGYSLISPDGHTALVPVGVDGDVTELRQAAPALQRIAGELSTDRVHVYFTGYSPLAAAAVDRAGQDLGRAEGIGFPAAAVVLLIAFGSVVAAAIPLALGATAILAALGLLGVLSFFLQFSTITRSSVTMLAIALGIDYSLFIVARFREELAGTHGPSRADRAAAVGRALSTAGRAVLFSGTTVMISLGGLFLVHSASVRSMAVGLMAADLAMMLLSVTLLPALLGLLGGRVNSLALPRARRSLNHPDPERSGWAKLTNLVMRRPLLVAVGVTAVLAGLAMPALGLRYGVDTGLGAVKESPAGQGFVLVSRSFAPGVVAPVTVVGAGRDEGLTEAQLAAVAAVKQRMSGDDRVAAVASVTRGDTAIVTVYPVQAADDSQTQALVTDLRAGAAQIMAGAGLDTHIGGDPAQIAEITRENSRATPLVVGAVLAASWLLLLVVFRSLVLPVKAIAMNLLSVGAAFGLVVLVFQDGHGARLLDVHRTGFIQIMLPLLTFAVSFGLSMDYEVFMLSRMREVWQETGDNAIAVRLGITHTARVITSAALIMTVVFAAFTLTGMLEGKQLGFMLAVAVLLDATLVRLLLVPALMRLMGRWNWWLPALRYSGTRR